MKLLESSAQVDLTRHITLHVATLKFFHVWFYIPHPKRSYKFWVAVFTRVVLGLLVFVIPPAAQFIYIIRLVASGKAEIQEVASTINLVLTELLASFKLLDLRLRRDVLTQLSGQLISGGLNCSETHKRILEKGIKLSRRLFVGLLLGSGLDVFCHVVVVPALRRFETLPVKMDFIFFDVNDPNYFGYVCAYQILYKPMLVAIYVVSQTITWAFMGCANSQLDVLINKLENMKALVKITSAEKSCDENEAYGIIFKDCVLHHSAIIRFNKTMQEAFSGQLSMTLFVSACIIGTTAVQIFSIESPRKNITEVIWVLAYLSIFIGNLFVECYFGNAITHKGLQIGTVVFSGPWLGLPTKMKRNLVLFIAKAQQPIVLTAAKLTPVSIQTFTTTPYKGGRF
ncbi:hypothetical protein ABMA28_005744 [Loxostege sticticalis]|uniref:Odorant receptor n=1 Tax=Loxostege sticticalis TaxID=481309 RepID=A0ABD0SPY7_LOXSC